MKLITALMFGLISILSPHTALAAQSDHLVSLDFTDTWMGLSALILFVFAYALVIGEEVIHLRKSKPVMVAAGVIWVLVAIAFNQHGDTTSAHQMIQHNILEYAELLLFLLAAMTFVNTMEERNIFRAIRAWLVSSGYSLRTIFWVTGVMAFFISPIADNLYSK